MQDKKKSSRKSIKEKLAFVSALARGESQKEAYRRSFDCSGVSDATISNRAGKLRRSDFVREYLATLQKRTLDESIRGQKEVLADVRDTYLEARAAGDLKSGLRALELEAKILGLLKDKQQSEVSGTLEISWAD